MLTNTEAVLADIDVLIKKAEKTDGMLHCGVKDFYITPEDLKKANKKGGLLFIKRHWKVVPLKAVVPSKVYKDYEWFSARSYFASASRKAVW